MTWQTTLLATGVVLWAAVQYGLAVHALRDLDRRPRVRGNNKVVWALVILGIPIAGALVYAIYGPTSFIRRDRPRPPRLTQAPDPLPGTEAPNPPPAPRPADRGPDSGHPPHHLPPISDEWKPTEGVVPSPQRDGHRPTPAPARKPQLVVDDDNAAGRASVRRPAHPRRSPPKGQ